MVLFYEFGHIIDTKIKISIILILGIPIPWRDGKMAYKKCPRCSLNYIKDTDVLCKICLEEVGKALRSNDEEEDYDICPECGEHIIKVGEEMCYQCIMEQVKDDNNIVKTKEKSWGEFAHNEEDANVFEEGEAEEVEEIQLDLEED